MPGENIQDWSVTAANNGNSDTSIEWREGQTRASVNNSARSEMAAHAKNRNLLNGSIVTGGSANAQTFTSGVGYIAPIPTGLIVKLKIGAALTNTASPTTLNMDGIGDTVIKTDDGENIKGGELVGGTYVDFLFNGTNWIFLYSREFFQELISGGGGVIIGKQIFSTAGTFSYTPTATTECCIIECVGGGGGGGCASSATTLIVGGGGGGSGSYSRTYSDIAGIGASQTIVVGAAGIAAASPGTGGNGGDTSLGTLCIAKGGSGGGGSIAGGSFAPGGEGGAVGTGDVTAAGSPGQTGIYSSTTSSIAPGGGAGGSSCFGGGAVGNTTGYGSTAAGAAARNYGAGGGGSVSHGGTAFGASGAGSAGIVIITEFAGRGAPGRDGETGPIGPAGPSGPGTGDVLRSGTPTVGQVAVWTDASHIQGVAPSSLITGLNNIVIQAFTVSGTYTPAAAMKYCLIECVGGGGGGGGVSGGATFIVGGGGGGAGGYSRKRATAADVGASKAVTIGNGGTGGAGASNGGAGGVSSVGTLCVANGGMGGGATTTGSVSGGGLGATAGIGDVAATGASGHPGLYWSGAPGGFGPPAGGGGNSYFGGGGTPGQGIASSDAVAGHAATGYGAGGGGASSNCSAAIAASTGGAGSPGLVIITEFI